IAEHAATLGADRGRIAVGGDSAGGNLAAVVALMARDRGGPKLVYQLLIYPATDADFETRSCRENAEGYFLTRADMIWFWNHYAPRDEDRRNPYAAPLRAASLGGLPPALVITAEFDPLRDEGEAYAARLREEHAPVRPSRDDGIPLAQPEARRVLGRHHDDVTMAVPAVEVLLLVDDGVELPLGAQRHQAELARGRRKGGERRHVEVRPPIAGREGRRVQHPAGDVELPARAVDVADGSIAGHHLGHLLAQALVRAEGGPVEPSGRQDELGECGDDLDLGA